MQQVTVRYGDMVRHLTVKKCHVNPKDVVSTEYALTNVHVLQLVPPLIRSNVLVAASGGWLD